MRNTVRPRVSVNSRVNVSNAAAPIGSSPAVGSSRNSNSGSSASARASPARFFWREEFDLQNNRYVVRFNNPLTNPLDEPESYTNSIYLNKSDTVGQMKARIAEIVGLPVAQFLIKKGTSNFPEMRELSLTLGASHMWKNSQVFVEIGTPTQEGEHEVVVFRAELSQNALKDAEVYAFQELFSVLATAAMTVRAVKELLCRKHNAQRAEGVKHQLRESFKRAWKPEQYATFEQWRMDPTEVQGVPGSPWKQIESRVVDRAKQLGWSAPDQAK